MRERSYNQMVSWLLPTHVGWEKEECEHGNKAACPMAQPEKETGCSHQVKGSPELKEML